MRRTFQNSQHGKNEDLHIQSLMLSFFQSMIIENGKVMNQMNHPEKHAR